MKDMYHDEYMNDVAYSIWEFLSREEYTLADLLKIITDVSAVQQMLREAYADDVLSTKDGCRALYKRLDDIPAADVISRKEVLELIESFKVERRYNESFQFWICTLLLE